MIWEDKTEIARLLNNGMYKEAVDFISDKEMDNQSVDIFLTGFNLTNIELLRPIKELFVNINSGHFSFRRGIRLEIIKEHFKQETTAQ